MATPVLYTGTRTRAEKRERREQIAEKVRAGLDAATVANLFGVSIATVYASIRKDDLPRNQRRKRNEQIVERIRAGKSPEAVQEEFGVGIWTIRSICNAAGVKVICKQVLSLSAFRFIALLLNTKLSQAEIARELGVSPQMVNQYVQEARKAGIKFPKR